MAKLNKEEKRRLEKLAQAEVDEARSRLRNEFSNETDTLKKKLAKNPPKTVAKKAKELIAARKLVKKLEKYFDDSPYSVSNGEREYVVGEGWVYTGTGEISANHEHPDVQKLSRQQNDRLHKLDKTMKSFSIRLLDSADALALFEELQKEIASL